MVEVTSTAEVKPKTKARSKGRQAETLKGHIVEVVSDSGEGAQKCGQSFATIGAKMGNGIWTVEIIPAEIQPPARSVEGASGIRIRMGSYYVTNGGDEADLVVAFNEQVLLGRVKYKELKKGCTILLEDKWRTDASPEIAKAYKETYDQLIQDGFKVYEIPMEEECLKYVADPTRGKNMFVLGLLVNVYSQDLQIARDQISFIYAKQSAKIISSNIQLLEAGYEWADENLDFKFKVPSAGIKEPQIVVNGNTAVGLGVMASGMEICAMYPITPATSASHYLSDVFESVGGMVHQAEDEIAACCFAIGASYAGKCAVTITSGPGYSLKQEGIGLAVMAEIPLVVVNVQRGGPATGQPTKMEQGDLLAAVFGSHGDAPKIVLAPSDMRDCFYSMITARRIAEAYNTVVVVLTDANIATAQQPFPRPKFQREWLAPPIDQSPVPEGVKPYDWDEKTGLASRFIPGRPGGMHTLTGLAHDRLSHVASQEGIECPRDALEMMARTATGSMRDAINLLEQLVDSYGKAPSLDQVREGLGLVIDVRSAQLSGHVLRGELAEGLELIASVRDDGLDLRQFQRQVVAHLLGYLVNSPQLARLARVGIALDHLPANDPAAHRRLLDPEVPAPSNLILTPVVLPELEFPGHDDSPAEDCGSAVGGNQYTLGSRARS